MDASFDRETVVLIETLDVYAGGLDAEIKSHLRAMGDLSIESHPDPISLVRLGESARSLAGLADTLVTILGVKFNLDGTEGDEYDDDQTAAEGRIYPLDR